MIYSALNIREYKPKLGDIIIATSHGRILKFKLVKTCEHPYRSALHPDYDSEFKIGLLGDRLIATGPNQYWAVRDVINPERLRPIDIWPLVKSFSQFEVLDQSGLNRPTTTVAKTVCDCFYEDTRLLWAYGCQMTDKHK